MADLEPDRGERPRAARGAEPVVAEIVVEPESARVVAPTVAQAMAQVVQGGGDYVRAISMMASSAIGAAMTRMLSQPDPACAELLAIAQRAVDAAAESFHRIGVSAAEILEKFPEEP